MCFKFSINVLDFLICVFSSTLYNLAWLSMKVQVMKEYNIENGTLKSVLLDTDKTIEAEGLFISIGSVPSTGIYELAKDKGFIVVDDKCMTSVENVYACGDIIKKNVYQLTTAAAEGTIAANSILNKLKIVKK